MMPQFDRQWQQMSLNDEKLRQLQDILLQNPKAGLVVKNTGGLRKIRIPSVGKGKRGGGRVAYVDFTAQATIYFITAYSKNEKDNLSKKERNDIAMLIARLEQGIQRVKK